MSLTLERLDQLAGEYLAESEALSEWDTLIEYARERAAREACTAAAPTYRLHVCQTGDGRWFASPLDDRGLGVATGIAPTPTAAYLALKEDLGKESPQ